MDRECASPLDVTENQVRNDVAKESFRWITVGATSQPEVSIVLTNYVNGSPADNDAAAGPVAKSALNGFDATFEKLSAFGTDTVSEPADQPRGTRDFALRDPSSNLVRIDQPPAAWS